MPQMNPRILEEQISGLTHTYRIACERSAISAEVDRELKKIGRNASLRGFRKGRAPLSVLRAHYGAKVQTSI